MTTGLPDGEAQSPESTVAEGPILVNGAPYRKKMPDREVDLDPIRYFTAALNPTKDLFLLSQPSGETDLLLSRIDGSHQQKIFHFDRTQNFFAALGWSRDGEWIAFTRGTDSLKQGADSDIWKMRWDGSDLQNTTPNSPSNDSYPRFSGDGKQIVFRSG